MGRAFSAGYDLTEEADGGVHGPVQWRELLLTGDLIDAKDAARMGLINRVVPLDRLAAEVDSLADRLALGAIINAADTPSSANRTRSSDATASRRRSPGAAGLTRSDSGTAEVAVRPGPACRRGIGPARAGLIRLVALDDHFVDAQVHDLLDMLGAEQRHRQ